MDLNNFTLNATGAGTLTISLTDTDFNGNGNGGTLIQMVGGTNGGPAGSTATFTTYKDPGNTEFGTTLAFSTLGPFGPGAFSATPEDPHGPLDAYSMTQVATLVFTGAGSMSFDFSSINDSPEPSTLAIAGLGVLELVGYGLRRRPA